MIAVSGAHSVSLISAGISYGQAPGLIQLAHAPHSTPAITKARLVYHPTYSGNFAYLEVYLSQAKAVPISVNLLGGQGWTLVAPSTAGAVPSGYSIKELTLAEGKIVANIKGYAEDIAIGGNAADLASMRGQIGDSPAVTAPANLNDYTRQGNWFFFNAAIRENFLTTIGGWLSVYERSGYIYQTYRVVNSDRTWGRRRATSGVWTAWASFVASTLIGDGITVNNGILSVPLGTEDTAGLTYGDGLTLVTDSDTVRDVAIGGDTRDLASKRGQIGDAMDVAAPNYNTLVKSDFYHCYQTDALNGPGAYATKLHVLAKGRYICQIACRMNATAISARISQDEGATWTAWDELATKGDVTASLRSCLPLSGGTLTGNVAFPVNEAEADMKTLRLGIRATDTDGTVRTFYPIRVIPGSTVGRGLVLSTGGPIILGGGESAQTFAKGHIEAGKLTGETEYTYITSDNGIEFYYGQNANYDGTKKVVISSTGDISMPGKITASGGFKGNSDTATNLATARTIALSGDVTASGTFDGSGNLALTAALKNSGAAAGAYGPTANATPAFGAAFNVPQITVDDKGRVTAAATRTVKIPANPVATQTANGLLSAADKKKLDGFAASGIMRINYKSYQDFTLNANFTMPYDGIATLFVTGAGWGGLSLTVDGIEVGRARMYGEDNASPCDSVTAIVRSGKIVKGITKEGHGISGHVRCFKCE